MLSRGPLAAVKKNKGLWRNISPLALVRWDEARESTLDNLVLLHYSAADEHEENGVAWSRQAKPDESAFIESRLHDMVGALGGAPP